MYSYVHCVRLIFMIALLLAINSVALYEHRKRNWFPCFIIKKLTLAVDSLEFGKSKCLRKLREYWISLYKNSEQFYRKPKINIRIKSATWFYGWNRVIMSFHVYYTLIANARQNMIALYKTVIYALPDMI